MRLRTIAVASLVIGMVTLAVLSPHDPGSIAVAEATPAPHDRITAEPAVEDSSSGQSAGSGEMTRVPSTEGCQDLQPHVNVSEFVKSMKLCVDAACRGTLRLAMRKCALHTQPLSTDAAFDQWQRRHLGANTLRLRLDGPEAHIVPATYDAPCEYTFTMPPLFETGTYTLGFEWLYDDFAALDEITNRWPPLKKQSMLQLDTSFRTNYHLQQCTKPSVVKMKCRGGDRPTPHDRCNGMELYHGGAWVRQPGTQHVTTRVRVKKIQRAPILFQWALQREPLSHWVPSACHSTRIDPKKFTKAFSGKRIVVGGDSQLRALYFGLVNTLLGMGVSCVSNLTSTKQEPTSCVANVKGGHRKDAGGVKIDFVDDLFLGKLPSRYEGYDVVVTGFAQHPASREHWTSARFLNTAKSKVAKAAKLRDKATVVWYAAPQYPHTTNGYPVVVRDWRTDPRLRHFNDMAMAEARRHMIPSVDAFAISTAMGHTSPDQAHFSNFVSTELVNMLLNVICNGAKRSCA
jgi:hypothetical protein